jgi:NADH:ubiquinone oxidoreductase subunit 5 (subunit L)/multisubunit Na+/H+ antiporter MnhA subunit
VLPAATLPESFSVADVEGEVTLLDGAGGVAGAVVSLTKLTGSEQADVLPAASVAVAAKLVDAFCWAVTAKPTAKSAALPLANWVPAQEELS